MPTTSTCGAKSLAFVVLLGLTLIASTGAVDATQNTTDEGRQGSCIVADPSGPSVGVNPECRPVGPLPLPWLEYDMYHRSALPFSYEIPWMDEYHPEYRVLLGASLPGTHDSLGHHTTLTLDPDLFLTSYPDPTPRGGHAQ